MFGNTHIGYAFTFKTTVLRTHVMPAVLDGLSVSGAPPTLAALRGGRAEGTFAVRARLPVFGVACLLGFVVGKQVGCSLGELCWGS